ncbi:Spy/CpxP family protein refolding chaperone [Nitrospinota bacterium]
MRKRISKYAVVAILGISLAVPAIGLAHSEGGFPSGKWTASGWMGRGMMGMGPRSTGWGTSMMGMGSGMMDMMHGMMGMGPGTMSGYGASLTDEQQKKFADIQSRFLKESVKPQTELIRARAALQALLSDPAAKEEAIEEQVQKAATAQARLFVLRIRTERETDKLYTKEQREQMTRGSAYGPMGMMGPGGRGNPCATQGNKGSF